MAFVDWTDKLSVGVTQIDQQHKRLVALINQLHEAMREGKGRTVIGPVVSELVAYAKLHFAGEEQLMKAHRYPGLPGHQAIHATFTAEVMALQGKLESQESVLTTEVMSFLRTWLVDHIMKTDQQYAPFVSGASVK
jgi:hemerythrin